MIQKESIVNVIDNSGAKTAKCIGFHKGRTRVAGLGDIIVVSVQRCTKQSQLIALRASIGKKKKSVSEKRVIKGEVCLAVVVQTRQPTRRAGGERVSFRRSAVVLVNDNGVPRGTRLLNSLLLKGAVAIECNNLNILSLASHIA